MASMTDRYGNTSQGPPGAPPPPPPHAPHFPGPYHGQYPMMPQQAPYAALPLQQPMYSHHYGQPSLPPPHGQLPPPPPGPPPGPPPRPAAFSQMRPPIPGPPSSSQLPPLPTQGQLPINFPQQSQAYSANPVPRPQKGVETEEQRRERKRKEWEQKKEHEDRKRQHIASKDEAGGVSGRLKPPRDAHRSGEKVRGDASVKSGAAAASAPGSTENRLRRKSTFVSKIQFRNELPEPASQMKLLQIPMDPDRYTKYKVTSLEKNYKHKLLVEPDLGIPLDLLDVSVYNAPAERPALAPEDLALLQDEPEEKRREEIIPIKERPKDAVDWLVMTEYIAPVTYESTQKRTLSEKEWKERREMQKGLRSALMETRNDRSSQIKAIEDSFEFAKQTPVHPTNKDLRPVAVFPLLPNLDRAADKFVQLQFDADPTEESEMHKGLDRDQRDHLESRAVLKSFTTAGSNGERGSKFLAYLLPAIDEIYVDPTDADVSYNWVREYTYDPPKRDPGSHDTYLFAFDDDYVFYSELNMKLDLHKRKAKEAKVVDPEEEEYPIPSKITIRERPLDEDELDARDREKNRFLEG